EGCVTVSRASRTSMFPARFMLIGAMNPCPCGFAGDPMRECRCTPEHVRRYHDRLSGPLRDRLDLTVDVPAVSPELLCEAPPSEPSAAVRERVLAARARQHERYDSARLHVNAELTPSLMTRHCAMDRDAMKLLKAAIRQMAL